MSESEEAAGVSERPSLVLFFPLSAPLFSFSLSLSVSRYILRDCSAFLASLVCRPGYCREHLNLLYFVPAHLYLVSSERAALLIPLWGDPAGAFEKYSLDSPPRGRKTTMRLRNKKEMGPEYVSRIDREADRRKRCCGQVFGGREAKKHETRNEKGKTNDPTHRYIPLHIGDEKVVFLLYLRQGMMIHG